MAQSLTCHTCLNGIILCALFRLGVRPFFFFCFAFPSLQKPSLSPCWQLRLGSCMKILCRLWLVNRCLYHFFYKSGSQHISFSGSCFSHSRIPTQNKNLCSSVHSSIIHNCQKVKTRKCPSTDEWINKTWYIHTMEYYSAIKGRKQVLQHGWNLKTLCYVKGARRRRPHSLCFHLCEMSRRGKSTEAKSRLPVARGCTEGEIKRHADGHWASSWDDENGMTWDRSDGSIPLWRNLKPLNCTLEQGEGFGVRTTCFNELIFRCKLCAVRCY